jgi:hypothetical protein
MAASSRRMRRRDRATAAIASDEGSCGWLTS